tara:strand:+ start:587 stop:2047 length:1461 start_codon:yes stop_codon:yes gene_type:complete
MAEESEIIKNLTEQIDLLKEKVRVGREAISAPVTTSWFKASGASLRKQFGDVAAGLIEDEQKLGQLIVQREKERIRLSREDKTLPEECKQIAAPPTVNNVNSDNFLLGMGPKGGPMCVGLEISWLKALLPRGKERLGECEKAGGVVKDGKCHIPDKKNKKLVGRWRGQGFWFDHMDAYDAFNIKIYDGTFNNPEFQPKSVEAMITKIKEKNPAAVFMGWGWTKTYRGPSSTKNRGTTEDAKKDAIKQGQIIAKVINKYDGKGIKIRYVVFNMEHEAWGSGQAKYQKNYPIDAKNRKGQMRAVTKALIKTVKEGVDTGEEIKFGYNGFSGTALKGFRTLISHKELVQEFVTLYDFWCPMIYGAFRKKWKYDAKLVKEANEFLKSQNVNKTIAYWPCVAPGRKKEGHESHSGCPYPDLKTYSDLQKESPANGILYYLASYAESLNDTVDFSEIKCPLFLAPNGKGINRPLWQHAAMMRAAADTNPPSS